MAASVQMKVETKTGNAGHADFGLDLL